MDFFTFIVIAVFIYSLFGKKDQPPQRRQRSAEDYQMPSKPKTEMAKPLAQEQGKKKESIFETLERQIRESAEQFEKDLRGEPGPRKPVQRETASRKYRTQTPDGTPKMPNREGIWGEEGRSDYDRYVTTQGTQGAEGAQSSEGLGGLEGLGGSEGTWGSEGAFYSKTSGIRASAIEQTQIGGDRKAPSPEKSLAGSLGFSPSAAVQGVIWAEILKEPKGRRGFSRR